MFENKKLNSALKIFKALCDETRLKIIIEILEGEKAVCKIRDIVGKSQPTISLQLSKLEDLGIVESKREGRSILYKVINPKIYDILEIAFDIKIDRSNKETKLNDYCNIEKQNC
jgi:DNA-binding transcriptional ArsR family regulator